MAKKHTLRSLLEPLGLYRLGTGGLVDAELAAYDAALGLLEKRLDALWRDVFLQTADRESLRLFEALVGLAERPEALAEDRRERVLYRLSTSPLDFTLTGMERSVRGAGMDAHITENYPAESLTIRAEGLEDSLTDLDAVKQSVSRMLPAHLGAEYDIGHMTWDMFDAAGPDWDSGWDSADFTWNSFDLKGHDIFTGGG